jgi:hypothetical protein
MGKPLPRVQAVGMTAAMWIALGLFLWLVHWLTEGGAAKADEPVRRPWLALLAPLLPALCRDMAIGRIDLPGLSWLGAGYGALVKAMSTPILLLVPAWLAPRISLMVANGLTYVLLPALLSLLFGVRLRARGLNWRSFWVGWVLSIPLIIINLIEWFSHAGTFAEDLVRLATNPLVNGYGEEFMHNGLVMPRLVQLTKSPTLGISLSALFFGLVHFWANRPHFPDAWSTLASCIVAQAPVALVSGYLAYRLRSLLAGSIFHVWLDT